MIPLWQFVRIYLSFMSSAGRILLTLFLFIVTLGGLFACVEEISVGNSVYYAFISALTIGYGDITPKTDVGKIIAVILGMVGIVLMGIAVAASVKSLEVASQNIAREQGEKPRG
jgi:voltage-gated potassium channel